MRKRFYSVYGKLGFAVVDDYKKVDEIREVLSSVSCKKTNSFGEAVFYARMKFLELNEELVCFETPKLGQIIFAYKLQDYDDGR